MTGAHRHRSKSTKVEAASSRLTLLLTQAARGSFHFVDKWDKRELIPPKTQAVRCRFHLPNEAFTAQPLQSFVSECVRHENHGRIFNNILKFFSNSFFLLTEYYQIYNSIFFNARLIKINFSKFLITENCQSLNLYLDVIISFKMNPLFSSSIRIR
ncbi:hypothetical protein [Geitlerinema calcuttense]|uniref:Uncharacterized protein n=1 Tax=Geitlerinema calcuttense NRMC-F 0142 TaxID=2922238 RepID=A0ABT7LY19_9CYAN|nr:MULTISPECIES: hypothetical protein [Cyanophyceae]MDL5052596.1 hypothetical protein [Oscillatoria laete-virens NRMC-F 0139]MDL5056899.1 hypothetical protein [Geitlerinema calcuttense NRMC-F 0142]